MIRFRRFAAPPVCVLSLFLAMSLQSPAKPASTSSGRAVVAYVFVQNNALQPGQIDAANLTRINYAFANIANGKIVTGFSKDVENYAFLAALKHDNPSLTVLVSVGGWEWSDKFSDTSLTADSRKIFVKSVMEFLEKYSLDGLDIDWEFPGLPGASQNFRSEDKQNFTRLIKELHKAFDTETAKTHKPLYLTIAAGSSHDFVTHTEMGKVQRYLHTVNLMCYDFYEPGDEGITGNHAPLFADPADPRKAACDDSIRDFESAGVPAAKIILGVPFYGHLWGQVADTNHGLFQPGKPVPHAYAPYSAIVDSMLDHGFVRYWDSSSLVPYLYNPEKQQFVSYEDPDSIAVKANYVRKNGLGGIMFWDYSGDPSGTLLHAVHDSLAAASATTAQDKAAAGK